MNSREARDVAIELIRQARQYIDAASVHPDPVAERRQMARAASRLRAAADHLDDNGALDPDWDKT